MKWSEGLIALILRLFPRAFRARFGAEMLGVFQDQRADAAQGDPGWIDQMRLTVSTALGLLRALPAAHIDARRPPDPGPTVTELRNLTMRNLMSDARYVIRTLRKQPGFTLVAILTLALGIGANTAVFSVLNSVILAPLPYNEPDQLVRVYAAPEATPDAQWFLTGPEIVAVRDEVDAFSSVGIMYTYREVGRDLRTDGPPQRIRVLQISADYFTTYRATPLLGRTFTREEEERDISRIILSHSLWQALTGGDEDILGRTVELNGEMLEVVGVMRPSFTDVVVGEVAAWIPQDLNLSSPANNIGNNYLTAVARLAPGVTLSQAQSQVDVVAARLAEGYPPANQDRILRVIPLHDDVVGESSAAVFILMGAAGLVLLIACLNVANLFLARSVSQTRETAIRTALGAGRGRVMSQRFTESVLVALAGGVVGTLVAYWGVQLLMALSPESLARAEEVAFDRGLLLFALAVTVITGLIFGAAPAVRASRVDPNDALRDGSRGNSGGRSHRRGRSILVASQVSVALVLLVGAGVLIKSFLAVQRTDLGFDPDQVATFEVHLPAARYGAPDQRVQFHNALHDRLNQLPGVRQVAATSWLPGNGAYHHWGVGYLDNVGEQQFAGSMVRIVDGEFFDALGIQVVQGRSLTTADRADTERVMVINELLAERVFGDRDPIGGQLFLDTLWRVVGVVNDVAHDVNGSRVETAYVGHNQYAGDRNWGLTYVIKTTTAPLSVIEPSRRAMSALDDALVLYRPRAMTEVVGRHLARDRFTMTLMMMFAIVAVTLAAVGVYGVLSYTVSQRTHEIGVRMALGARPGQVSGIVLRHGLVVAGTGMAIGLGGAYALSRFLESIVFGVSPRDPQVFGTVALVLAVVVVLAGYLPARRATRINPIDALRSE